MKKYIAPNMEVIAFRAEDIITTSGGGSVNPPATTTEMNIISPAAFDGALERF